MLWWIYIVVSFTKSIHNCPYSWGCYNGRRETLGPLSQRLYQLITEITKYYFSLTLNSDYPTRSRICNSHSAVEAYHYDDVIMSAIASQITSLTIVYSIVYSDADQRKHQSSASLAFVWGIHRGPVNSPHKWPVTQKMFPFDDVIVCKPWPLLLT